MAAMNTQRWVIVGLGLATAVIHFVLAFALSGGTIFLLNGLGYIALVAALYFIPQLAGMRGLVHWGLLAYTAVTFVLYFIMNWPDVWGPFGLLTKAIELVLIILLLMDRP